MNRLAGPIVLAVVTPLLAGYGRFDWSWIAGPIAAVAIWALDRGSQARLGPAPVD